MTSWGHSNKEVIFSRAAIRALMKMMNNEKTSKALKSWNPEKGTYSAILNIPTGFAGNEGLLYLYYITLYIYLCKIQCKYCNSNAHDIKT